MKPEDISKPSKLLVQDLIDRIKPTHTLTDIQVRHRATNLLVMMIDSYLRKVRAMEGIYFYEKAKEDLNKSSREELMAAVITAYKLRQLDYML